MIHISKTFSGGTHAIRILRWFWWKISFFKNFHFQVNTQLLKNNFILQFLENHVVKKLKNWFETIGTKFFLNSNFSDFLGIKSEMNHWIISSDHFLNRPIPPAWALTCWTAAKTIAESFIISICVCQWLSIKIKSIFLFTNILTNKLLCH